MRRIRGSVVDSGESALVGYLVQAFFERRFETAAPAEPTAPADGVLPTDSPGGPEAIGNTGGATTVVPPEILSATTSVVATTDANGQFTMAVPEDAELASLTVRFEVSTPSGFTFEREVNTAEFESELALVVEGRNPPIEVPPIDPRLTMRDSKLTGRVFDVTGRQVPAGLQVAIFGREAALPGTENGAGPSTPFLVTRTDGSGYFSGDQPSRLLQAAHATIATASETVPIALERGRLPSPVLLGVSLPDLATTETMPEDCGCKSPVPRTPDQLDLTSASETFSTDLGTGCVQFNVPNRAIEEFDFFTVVRTTEPFIRGIRPEGLAVRRDREVIVDRSTRIRFTEYEDALSEASERAVLTGANSVDWDSTPTFYEATSIAHGHLLHFKQVWYADGYSLGDLLYSLPLAPGQKRLVAVVDWERRDQANRSEGTTFSEQLTQSLSKDRDLSEVVSGTLAETMRGGSKATTAGVGVGTGAAGNGSYGGFNFGALIGVSGGYGEANSNAWMDASRTVGAQSLQRLRDTTLQSASALRGMRSTVVHAATQGESVRASTEVVANHNHCHALTVQYFEVLRHLKVTHELADVQECLFVPMPITPFDPDKVLRWRESLQPYLKRQELTAGFDATRRAASGWADTDYPLEHWADTPIEAIVGELHLTFLIPLPPLPADPPPGTTPPLADPRGEDGWDTAFRVFAAIGSGGASEATRKTVAVFSQGAKAYGESLAAEPTPEARYARFHHEVMPGLAAGFIDQLELWAIVEGPNGHQETKLNSADFTLVSDYRPGAQLAAAVRANTSQILRLNLRRLVIKSQNGLPAGCRVIVNDAVFRYRAAHFQHTLADESRLNDDIDLPTVSLVNLPGIPVPVAISVPGNGATIETPVDGWEMRNPRREDTLLSKELIAHLNGNLEYYHQAIWWTMDPSRRFMLLDGYVAPNAGGRSVASVVENRVLGIVGNSLVMPVARGVHLDPRFTRAHILPAPRPGFPLALPAADPGASMQLDLRAVYKPTTPIPAARVSLPTRGVFAEAVQGACNACEKIDESRRWRWADDPIDEPAALEQGSTASRRGEPLSTDPTAFPASVVTVQNAPSVPEPTGLSRAIELLGKDSFRDITGLAGNQQNAAAAYKQALETAAEFGKEASKLAQQAAMLKSLDKSMDSIDQAESKGKITPDDAKRLRTSALEKAVGGTDGPIRAADVEERLEVINAASKEGSIDATEAKSLSGTVLRSYVGSEEHASEESVAAAKLIGELPPDSVTSVETGIPPTKVQTAAGTGVAGIPGQWLADIAKGVLPRLGVAVASAPGGPGNRHCCALPGLWQADALDPAALAGHRYGAQRFALDPFTDPRGYVYTARSGLVDLGHARDTADMTRFVYEALVRGDTRFVLREGDAAVHEASRDRDAILELAAAVAYVESWAHELTTWEDQSSFSPEDLPSNIIGIELAKRAIKSGGPFNAGVDAAVNALIGVELGARPKSDTEAVLSKVNGSTRWFTMTGLVRRNFDGTPCWMARMTFDAPASIPWLSPSVFERSYTEFDYAIKKSVNGKTGIILATMQTTTDAIHAAFAAAHPGMDKPW
jgi:hypothetical protein